MNKFEKAKDLYFRGFSSHYIKQYTSFCRCSLTKHFKSENIRCDDFAVVDYQVAYIRNKYTNAEIINAYKKASTSYSDLFKSCKRKDVIMLGCGFGKLRLVFERLLGKDVYMKVRNDCWRIKQQNTMRSKYGCANAFENMSKFVSDSQRKMAYQKSRDTMLERYGTNIPLNIPGKKEQMIKTLKTTNLKLYGVEFSMQRADVAVKAVQNRQKTMLEKYGAANSVEIDAIRAKIFEKRRQNGTFTSSKPEDVLYDMLVHMFGADDVKRNVLVDNRYPYHVDFYIKSKDLFIELNGDRCHNNHWFDANSKRDLQILRDWQRNANRIERETGRTSRYKKFIQIWTVKDVEKRGCAKEHNLNYLVFWDGSNCNGVPRLSDAKQWFFDGCPYPYKKENTY